MLTMSSLLCIISVQDCQFLWGIDNGIVNNMKCLTCKYLSLLVRFFIPRKELQYILYFMIDIEKANTNENTTITILRENCRERIY